MSLQSGDNGRRRPPMAYLELGMKRRKQAAELSYVTISTLLADLQRNEQIIVIAMLVVQELCL